MKLVFKWLGRLFVLLVLLLAALAAFGPKEVVDLSAGFDPEDLGDDLDAYFASEEAKFTDIVPGTQKRVVWADKVGTRTSISVVYIHGFSASSEEIRPVPDNLAKAFGANLVFARLTGHGRTGEAMAQATAADWMRDVAQALAAGRAVGEKVIVVSTSTGGTLVAAAALREDLMERVAGAIFVSPNFALNSRSAVILTWPGVRLWGPLIAGAERRFDTKNDKHAEFWTNSYPTVALMPMAALVKAVDALDLGQTTLPALFVISDQDKVVSPTKTRAVAEEWGGASTLKVLHMGQGDDDYAHVIAGDIMSPGQTELATQAMIDWVRGLAVQ